MGKGPGRAGGARSRRQGTRRQDELTAAPLSQQHERSGVMLPAVSLLKTSRSWGDQVAACAESCARSSRGMADRDAHCGRDIADLVCRLLLEKKKRGTIVLLRVL